MRHRYTLTFDIEADTHKNMPTVDQLRETLEGVIPDEWYQPDEYVDGGMADFRLVSIGAQQTFSIIAGDDMDEWWRDHSHSPGLIPVLVPECPTCWPDKKEDQ